MIAGFMTYQPPHENVRGYVDDRVGDGFARNVHHSTGWPSLGIGPHTMICASARTWAGYGAHNLADAYRPEGTP